jgi:hypothetical protein
MRDRSCTRAADRHSTSSTALDGSQGSKLTNESDIGAETRRLESRRFYETSKHHVCNSKKVNFVRNWCLFQFTDAFQM